MRYRKKLESGEAGEGPTSHRMKEGILRADQRDVLEDP